MKSFRNKDAGITRHIKNRDRGMSGLRNLPNVLLYSLEDTKLNRGNFGTTFRKYEPRKGKYTTTTNNDIREMWRYQEKITARNPLGRIIPP